MFVPTFQQHFWKKRKHGKRAFSQTATEGETEQLRLKFKLFIDFLEVFNLKAFVATYFLAYFKA